MLQPDITINGRYRVLQLIGSGGMGSVYSAYDERLGRQVALKILRPDLALDQRARERFLREAQIAAQLIHPNIVRTYDVGDAPEGPYLVQELLAGQTLDTQLPLSPDQAISVIIGIADALGYIHAQGFVHCDIKPQNIMLLAGASLASRAMLLDFGIARMEGTDTTTLIATPHYLAPERMLGTAPTAASDLYALGVVFYQTLTGRPPFEGTLHEIIEHHRTTPFPPLTVADADPQTTAVLDSIIRKLTAKRPEERYVDAAALRTDLEAVHIGNVHVQPTVVVNRQAKVQPQNTSPALPHHPTLAPSQPKRRLWLLALPLLLVLFLVGAAIVRNDADVPEDVLPNVTDQVQTTQAQVRVPQVIGLPMSEAQKQLEAAGLTFVAGETLPSQQPSGIVLGIQPEAGQLLPPGTEVVVLTSAGLPAPAPVEQGGDDENKDKDDDKGKDKDDDKDKDKDDDKDKDKDDDKGKRDK